MGTCPPPHSINFITYITYHFFDFNLGGGFLGIKNSALIGCMSQRADG